jgi:hypothetical protein
MLPVCMYIVYPEDGAINFVLICQVSLCLYPGDCSLNFVQFLRWLYRLCETFPLRFVVLFNKTKMKITWAIVCSVV